MPIVNNGTRVDLRSSLIPTGFTAPSVTEFTDFECKTKTQISVLKSTVENSDRATTLTNIIEDATVGIEKQIEDKLTADYIGTNTTTFFAVLIDLNSNIPADKDNDFYTDTAVSYVATVEYFVKSTP